MNGSEGDLEKPLRRKEIECLFFGSLEYIHSLQTTNARARYSGKK